MTERASYGWQKISEKRTVFLFRFYFTLFLLGLLLTIAALCHEIPSLLGCEVEMPLTIVAIIGGSGMALVGSTLFYLRRLYKHLINEYIKPTDGQINSLQEQGVYYYYFLRPFFAIGFSLLIHISLKAGVSIMVVKETNLEAGFVYINMFLSFFGGFSSGDFITYLEDKGVKFLDNVIKSH